MLVILTVWLQAQHDSTSRRRSNSSAFVVALHVGTEQTRRSNIRALGASFAGTLLLCGTRPKTLADSTEYVPSKFAGKYTAPGFTGCDRDVFVSYDGTKGKIT